MSQKPTSGSLMTVFTFFTTSTAYKLHLHIKYTVQQTLK